MEHVAFCGLRPRALTLALAALVAAFVATVFAGEARALDLPPIVTITQKPTSPTSVPTFAFISSKAGSSFACKLNSDPWQACSTPKTYTGLAGGTHTFQVKAIDNGVESAVETATFTAEAAPAAFVPTFPASAGTINTTAPRFVTFNGTVTGSMPDADACDDVISLGDCAIFDLTTTNAGQVEVIIRWPRAMDPDFGSNLDVYVCAGFGVGDCAEVAVGATDRLNVETTFFTAVAGGQYQIRVVPFFLPAGVETFDGCAGYTNPDPALDPCGNPRPADTEPPPPPPPPNGDPAANFATSCSTGSTSAKVQGGGFVAIVDGVLQGKFALNVSVQSGIPNGRIEFLEDAKDLRLNNTRLTCMQSADYLIDGPGFEYRGYGNLTQKVNGQYTTREVCFKTISRNGALPAFGMTIYEVTNTRTCDTGRVVYNQNPVTIASGMINNLI